MNGHWGSLFAAVVTSVVFGASASADIVVDHQPHPYGGLGSDTDFLVGSTPVWQRVADNFRLTDAAMIESFVWWGFYDRDNPPATETMRIRVYHARPEDGLPDEDASYYEESFLNPTREATGRFIYVGIYPDEYRYEVNLSESLALEAETDYWLEIVQIGDRSTHFRWEYSLPDGSTLSGINITYPFWRDAGVGNNAFQLTAVPEPSVIVLMVFGVSFMVKRTRPRKED